MVIKSLSSNNFHNFYSCFQEIMTEGYSGFSVELQKHFLNTLYTPQFYQNRIVNSDQFILVAEDNNEVVGFLHANPPYGGVSYIVWLGVTKGHRGLGIATLLLNNLEELCKKQGAHMLELNTYDKVANFYTKNNYEKIGERKCGYFGKDAIIMTKKIAEYNENIIIPK